jgi:23S rRNA pseudouridine1911/1915/1917 synthase
MQSIINHEFIIPNKLQGLRLDQAIKTMLPQYSRSLIQHWLKNSQILLNDHPAPAKKLVLGQERITINAITHVSNNPMPQDLPLNIIHEDTTLLIIHKPAGMVVHPGAGNSEFTLVNALLHYCPQLQSLPRAGIVHRLDKNTSGLLAVAKTHNAYQHLKQQLNKRIMQRGYQALVCGHIISGNSINAPIARHPSQRQRMAIIANGKPAITHYRVLAKYRAHTRLKVILDSGRTHQIRVHMQYIKHPLIGDPTYGKGTHLPKQASQELITALQQCKRQALHADSLGLYHPENNTKMQWHLDLPKDLQYLVTYLELDSAHPP